MFEHGDVVQFERDGGIMVGRVWESVEGTDLWEIRVGDRNYSIPEDEMELVEDVA